MMNLRRFIHAYKFIVQGMMTCKFKEAATFYLLVALPVAN